MQYEQYEQEVRNLQAMIEDAHRVIQDQPVNTSNIQELQAQINHHEVHFFVICFFIFINFFIFLYSVLFIDIDFICYFSSALVQLFSFIFNILKYE